MGAALKPLLKRLAVGSPAALPTLDLDFLAQTYRVSDGAGGMSSVAFADLITFTRSSAAWRFNASGVLEQVPANQPRFDYDPVTLALRGLLVEEQRTNLLTYSSDLSNAVWSKSDSTISTDTTVAPDGSLMQKVTQGSAGNGYVARSSNITITAGTYSHSRFLKRGNHDWVVMSVADSISSANSARAWFNLATGVIGTIDAVGSVTSPAAAIEHVGNGIYRCTVSGNIPFATAMPFVIGVAANGSTARVAGGTRYDFGSQLEAGAFPTSYIPTTSSQVTRAADVASVNTLSPWFNPDEGTFCVEVTAFATSGFPGLYGTDDLSAYWSRPAANSQLTGRGSTGWLAINVPASSILKRADAYNATSAASSANGSAVIAEARARIASVSQLRLGVAGSGRLNGHIRRIRYWPRRLFDNELQRITA
ncbi:hypothetical protein [Pseudomonas citronellolis]|uniref:phage head spike fiber domain-containing protein n=1 Tax=Pseudomonas citronellolis TaxID=53408 RepID=UPI00248D7C62|nr:hypothetical protein [Pseudomonas citronellolis]